MRKAIKHFWQETMPYVLWLTLGACAVLFLVATHNAVEAATFDDWRSAIVTPETPVDVLTADIPDVECMALNIYHETRGESPKGREVVVASVYTRLADRHFPDTICGVVKQITRDRITKEYKGQYSWTLDGESDEAVNVTAYREVYLLAIEYMFMGKRPLLAEFDRIIGFHATWVNPDWSNWEYLYTEGGHKVYALPVTAANAARGRGNVDSIPNRTIRTGSQEVTAPSSRVSSADGGLTRWESAKRRDTLRRFGGT